MMKMQSVACHVWQSIDPDVSSSAMEGKPSTSKWQALVFDDGSPEEAKKKKPFFHIAKPTALLLFSNVN
jgi:hypothetical protein